MATTNDVIKYANAVVNTKELHELQSKLKIGKRVDFDGFASNTELTDSQLNEFLSDVDEIVDNFNEKISSLLKSYNEFYDIFNSIDFDYSRRVCESLEITTRFTDMFNEDIKEYTSDFGFDLMKFDDKFLKTPSGISINEYLIVKYSKEHMEFIQELINIGRDYTLKT